MTLDEIYTALWQHLDTMPDAPPIEYDNAGGEFPKPYLRTNHKPVSRVDPTVDCSIEADKTGLWLVTIVVESDTFTTQANTLAETVSMRYKQGTRLTAGNGTVLIGLSEPVDGYQDKNNDWNVPVRIRYRTETS